MLRRRDRRKLEFVDPPDDPDLWKCFVCEGHYENPLILPCGHNICRACLPDSLRCPNCSASFTLDKCIPNHPILVKAVQRLCVKCPNVTRGCSAVVGLLELDHHLGEDCPCRPVACSQCGEMVPLDHMGVHTTQECLMRRVPCREGCGESVPLARMEAHLADECLNRKIACSFAPIGCKDVVCAGTVAAHCRERQCAHLELLNSHLGHLDQATRERLAAAGLAATRLEAQSAEWSARMGWMLSQIQSLTARLDEVLGCTPHLPSPPRPPSRSFVPPAANPSGVFPFVGGRGAEPFSTVLMNPTEVAALRGFLGSGCGPLELLYRGSRDGFEAAAFHRACDGHAGTVVVVLTASGNLLGGYASVAWDAVPDDYVADPYAFLFSLRRAKAPAAPPVIILQRFKNSGNAIRCRPIFGPVFGGGYDLALTDRCNAAADSYAQLGNTYAVEEGDPYFLNGGVRNFQVREIEVFGCPRS
ncbi:hypothetical protein PAPYR_3656 [Paratrimastix pyriformis]|uniref:Uncharacterized protein n=1 Tax=Paratrimastix pyriformis TaxID=342808 RepID=A0ABQ8UM55_9EUKA|nr:hypothetical protein PAPYR_3656 [Paratrimastix pyriformis]